ncbi:stage II sporulation protein D [Thermosediminibacter oceani]|uniref:SpoIID/LytB domain protein n=1 Tax=Thermosediminibacter oceani (strain ATCC BAA-1034 / DSM 16646 / JW/IW-1228P) TaxID=555079 RepID=D9RZD4_THEOJ|nr:stage II sporulation protein D [Thermosediminibacter oceani]ADL06832.1 SpoIID/LytB domain protein [Thermosediminibacter oceani DSM 16646]
MAEECDGLKVRVFDVEKKRHLVLEMEEYVAGAVAYAMPAEFPPEALKAQAICARTIAVRRMRAFGGTGCRRYPDYDLCSDPLHCQGFLDEDDRRKLWGARFGEYMQRIKKAVEDTFGIILTFNGKPIEAVYHRACGGYTEDSESVWGNRVAYLRRVECNYCKDSPYWRVTRTFSIRQLKKRLGIKLDENCFDKRELPGLVDEVQSTPSGRVKRMRIGDRVFDGTDVKKLLDLPSTRFGWKVSSITFEALGTGHGLGMCQCGAMGMALLGFPFDEILKFYFTGVELSDVVKPTAAKPLSGKVVAVDPGRGGEADHCGPMGLSEGYVNLEIARVLAAMLVREGAQVVMTREKDEYKSLSERVKIINQNKADIAMSIHQSFHSDESMGGTEVFYFPGDKKARMLSLCVHRELISALNLTDHGVKEADLYILRETNIPCIVVNVAHLSNPEEERLLSEREFREKAARAILSGIKSYYQGLLKE